VWWRSRCRATGVRLKVDSRTVGVKMKVAVLHDWSDGGCATFSCTVAVSWCGGGRGWSVVAETSV